MEVDILKLKEGNIVVDDPSNKQVLKNLKVAT